MIKTTIYKTTKTGTTEKEAFIPGEVFHFSEEDKNYLLGMIRNAGLIPVDYTAERYFILYLEFYITQFLWLKDAPRREYHRAMLNDAIKSFKETVKHIEILEKDYLPVVNLRTLETDIKNLFIDAESQSVILSKLNDTKETLSFLLKEIEKYQEPKRTHWKTSYKVTTQLFINVAKILNMQFNNLNLSKHKNGFFFSFCEALLESMNVSLKDITRACNKAIDAVRPSLK